MTLNQLVIDQRSISVCHNRIGFNYGSVGQSYARADGVILNIGVAGWDSGGHYTDDVYAMSKKLGVMRVIPVRGANVYGKPIANFPRKRTAKGVYLTEVGTDNAKELIMAMLRIDPDVDVRKPGAIHFPLNESVCDDIELQQLTAERKIPKRENGRIVYRWDAGKRRNEALDCFVYALAALRISQEKFGLDLDLLASQNPETGGWTVPEEPPQVVEPDEPPAPAALPPPAPFHGHQSPALCHQPSAPE